MYNLSPLNFPKIDSTSSWCGKFPKSPGIYFVWDSNNDPVYIGASIDIQQRFKQRGTLQKRQINDLGSFVTVLPWDKRECQKDINVSNQQLIQMLYGDMLVLENIYINIYKPPLNKSFHYLSDKEIAAYYDNATNTILNLIDVHFENFPERVVHIMELTANFLDMRDHQDSSPEIDGWDLGYQFLHAVFCDMEDALSLSYKSETGQDIVCDFLEINEFSTYLLESWREKIDLNILAYKCLSLSEKFFVLTRCGNFPIAGILPDNKLIYDSPSWYCPSEEPNKAVITQEIKPIDPLDKFFDSDSSKLALEQSGLSKKEFIHMAIESYINRPNSTDKSISEMSIQELKANKKKSGVGVLLVEKAIDRVMEYNSQCQNRDERYQISINLLKELTGCATATIQLVTGKYDAIGTKTESIENHHKMMEIPYSPVFNRGKPSITIAIDFS
ncbi:MAG: hypothetical protein J7647_01410 [Cyanobacteria bacterium SBLK]|nr:hypothetical protein [Cyanobacteria bacterium SBLK]